MAGDEDDGDVQPGFRHPPLEVQTAQARQAHIQHKAAGYGRAVAAQELLRGGERGDAEPDGPDEVLQRAPHRRIVVDDEDHRVGTGHDSRASPTGTVN